METDGAAAATVPKKVTGRRVLYWIGGLFAFAVLFNTTARLIDPEGYDKRQKEQSREAQLENDQAAAASRSDGSKPLAAKADGSHCLSGWDGSNRSLKTLVQNGARNPDSFEHIETRIRPAVANEKTGELEHPVIMRFRAENGFGGMNVGVAVASVASDTCAATLINLTEG